MASTRTRLAEYRKHLKREHPDTEVSVRVVRNRGWVKFPTGVEQQVIDLELTGEGYRTRRATMFVERTGAWHVR